MHHGKDMYNLFITLLFSFILFFTSSSLFALDFKSKKIGVANNLNERITLAYFRKMGASGKLSTHFFYKPDWKLSDSLSDILTKELNKNGFKYAESLNKDKDKDKIFAGFHTDGKGTIDNDYIQNLHKINEIKNFDYLLLVTSSLYIIQGPDLTLPAGNIFVTVPGQITKLDQYGFHSPLYGDLGSFLAVGFFIIDIKQKEVSAHHLSLKTKKTDYTQPLTDKDKSKLYEFAEEQISDIKRIKRLKEIIFNTALNKADKDEIKEIFKKDFSSSDDIDTKKVLDQLKYLLLDTYLTPKTFQVQLNKNSEALHKHMIDIQKAVADDIIVNLSN